MVFVYVGEWLRKVSKEGKSERAMAHLLEVKGLTTAFTGDYGKNISVDHIDFYVDEGEVVCIVGV